MIGLITYEIWVFYLMIRSIINWCWRTNNDQSVGSSDSIDIDIVVHIGSPPIYSILFRL